MAEENNNVDKKSEGKKTTNLFIIGLFSFLITVVVAGTFLIITLKSPSPAPAPNAHAEAASPGQHKEEIGPLVSLGQEIIVNITSDAGAEHYLKVNITFELKAENHGKKGGHGEAGGPEVEEVTKRIPQIRDAVITILRSKTKEKIDEKEGKDLIRSEIINTVNKFLISGRIKNVYFQDFVIQ
ncbi:MAG TPA: flagellar basal body-associated FliL family protein [Bacillota bacterium]|nr:flagellar basal body-associated FliL family protein [Bacillota bacterium]